MLKVSSFNNHTYRNLSTKAKRLIFFLYPYVDLDHSLTISKEQLMLEFQESPLFTPALFEAAWNELLQNSYLHEIDGTVYSTYVHLGNNKPTNYQYIPQLELFQDEAFCKENKRNLDLFFFVATSRLPGQSHDIKIERLYYNKSFANKTNRNEKILFPNFKGYYDIKKHLLELVKDGRIEVDLISETTKNIRRSITLGKNRENAEQLLDEHCEKMENRKRRFSNRRTHTISLRIAPAVVNAKFTKYEIDSSILDLRQIAREYGWRLPFLYSEDVKVKNKSVEQIHMFKRQLIDQFGAAGIQYYRKALHNYFKNKSAYFEEHFNSFAETKDWTNYITNFYVIPLLKEHVLTFSSTWEKLLSKKELLNSWKSNLDSTLGKQLFEQRDLDLIKCDEEINEFQQSLKPFVEYYSNHSTAIAKYDLLMEFSKPLQKVLMELNEWKPIFLGARKHAIELHNQQKLEDMYKHKVPFIEEHMVEDEKSEFKHNIPFYNWLEK